MHQILAKIARFAVSKAAAFCYAVAVGVAGNIIFHFVQLHNLAPATAALAPAPTAAAPSVPRPPGTASIEPPATADRAPAPAARTFPPEKPPAPRPAATPPPLPEPPAALDLPKPAALPIPALRPTALPSPPASEPVGSARQETASGDAATRAAPAAATDAAPPAALPPLGPAIEVAIPPTPHPGAATAEALPREPAAQSPAAPPESAAAPARSLELSDIWHPGRAVEKGLNWAGDQLPALGGGKTPPAVSPPASSPGQPISLWPAATQDPLSPDLARAPPAAQIKPGPGSGGLY